MSAGPAVVASIAYVDPGNIAVDIQAGARHGLHLLPIVLAANLVAMLFQALSAKLGIVSGSNLAELCRLHLPRPVAAFMWVASEIGAMATDLAELMGGAIGFSLLLHIPLFQGMVVCAVAAYGILLLQNRSLRPIEMMAALCLGIIALSYAGQLALLGSPAGTRPADLIPPLDDPDAIALSVALIGATVMPHALYLHSAMTQDRSPAGDEAKRQMIRFHVKEAVVALGLAGLVNLAMVAMGANAFNDGVHDGLTDLSGAYEALTAIAGGVAAGFFLLSLILSGLSSSVVGTLSGQVIMQGFTTRAIPLWVRRTATILPAFAVVLFTDNAVQSLVWSQAVLSLILPLPLAALILFTSRKSIMGALVNSPSVTAMSVGAALFIGALNLLLIVDMFR